MLFVSACSWYHREYERCRGYSYYSGGSGCSTYTVERNVWDVNGAAFAFMVTGLLAHFVVTCRVAWVDGPVRWATGATAFAGLCYMIAFSVASSDYSDKSSSYGYWGGGFACTIVAWLICWGCAFIDTAENGFNNWNCFCCCSDEGCCPDQVQALVDLALKRCRVPSSLPGT